MNNKFIYTPGPTIVRENVRFELAKNTTNPDIDIKFYDFYKNTCKKISSILNTQNDIYILSGEGNLRTLKQLVHHLHNQMIKFL